MRILLARLLVAVTGLLIVALAILFALLRSPRNDVRPGTPEPVAETTPEPGVPPAAGTEDVSRQAPRAAMIARGRAVYVEQRCGVCHSIGGEGNTRSPLDGVGARLTEKEIRLWIVAPQEMNPAVRKRPFRLSEDDLNALVAYLTASSQR
jgi:mono/diheme cytochrome c family protein